MGYGELIRHNANFRRLWAGQIISLLGDWFNLIASTSLVAALTQSGWGVGSLLVVRLLAPFIVSPVAGVLADRYDRKRIIIATNLIRAVVVLGFLLVRSPDDLWLLYLLTAMQLALSGFFQPAWSSILPDIVPARAIGAANALTAATWSVMLALGAALGGLVAGTWGADPAFVIDALTFVLAALVLVRIKTPPKEAHPTGAITSALGEYIEGLRYLKRHPDILATAHHKAALMLCFGASIEVVQVAISRDVFVLGVAGSLGLGLLYAATGVGTGISPIIARHFSRDQPRRLRRSILLGYLLAIAGLLIIAPLASFALVLVGMLVRACGSGIIWVFATQLLMQLVPDKVRGRVFATEHALWSLGGALGALWGAYALERNQDISQALYWMASITLVPALLWGLWLIFYRPRDTPP